MKTIQLHIEGMSCGHCKKHVEDAFTAKAGVTAVEVSLEKATAAISFDEILTDESTIKTALNGSLYAVV
jgi:copper chaperone CopZ